MSPLGQNVCDLQPRLCKDNLEKSVEILSSFVILARRDFHIPQWLFSLCSILSPLTQLALITLYDQKDIQHHCAPSHNNVTYLIVTKLSKGKSNSPQLYIVNWVQQSLELRHKRWKKELQLLKCHLESTPQSSGWLWSFTVAEVMALQGWGDVRRQQLRLHTSINVMLH